MLTLDTITTIFFDLDHTLWDFEKNSELTFKKIFEEEKMPLDLNTFIEVYSPINHECWKLYRNNKITHIELRNRRLEKTFEVLDFEYNKSLLDRVNTNYISYLSDFTHLFEGIHQLLKKLESKYDLHIITNGFNEVQFHKMNNSGLTPYFKEIITAEQAGYKKPSPKIFEYALGKAAKTSSESLMIGDSFEADIQGALGVQMQAIHFNSHNEASHNACPIVHSLPEIESLLQL